MNSLMVHNPYPCGEASLSLLLQRKEAKKGARKCQLQGVLVARGLPELGLNTLQFASRVPGIAARVAGVSRLF
jgi:hypothetical protein